MTLEGLSSICAKLELARSRNNKILAINVLQKFTSHVTCETRVFWQFLLLKNRLLLKFENRSCVKPTHTHIHTKRFPQENRFVSLPLLVSFCKPETSCLCGSHRQQWSECYFHLPTFRRPNLSFKPKHSMADKKQAGRRHLFQWQYKLFA